MANRKLCQLKPGVATLMPGISRSNGHLGPPGYMEVGEGGFTKGLPKVYQRFTKGFTKGLPKVSQRFTKGLPKVYQRFTKGLQKVYKRFTKGYQRFTKGLQKVYKRFTKGLPRGYQRLTFLSLSSCALINFSKSSTSLCSNHSTRLLDASIPFCM